MIYDEKNLDWFGPIDCNGNHFQPLKTTPLSTHCQISDLETAFGNWNEFRTTITHDHVKQENGYVEALVEDDEKAPLEKEGTTHDYVEMFSTCSCTDSCLNDEGEACPETQEHVVKALVEDEKAPLKRKGEKGVGWVLGSMAGGMLIGMALMGFVMASFGSGPNRETFVFLLLQEDPETSRTELCFQTLCDRVSALESRFERLINANVHGGDRKYTWMAEIKGPVERKYKWTAEIKEGKKNKEEKKAGVEKNYKWTAEIKGKEEEQPISRKYTFEVSRGDATDFQSLSERRSKVLRALRELAIAKSKLKEIRSLFNNFSYRRQVARDAVERQRFSEKSLSCFSLWMLLRAREFLRLKFHTLLKGYKLGRFIVDLNWKGTDLMVRAAKRSMVDELEAMLDVVDPQPPGKLNSMKRRIFDMPDGVIRKEIAEGVAQVVQMLDNEENLTSTFEACL
ncbi:hypothetical protein GH714_026121 [Hevea brasiliensis]|uniref:Uncharacterized protein n=1 Tax=Hevea brasiliensis TaxID=3981 RepID=A0A6A6MH24_HEVBR|nr:hypothetical protein GH714_026121 [Hevea brasiliensis]